MNEEYDVIRKRWHFTIVENSILESDKLNTYDKMVYIILCKFASRDSASCFPTHSKIAQHVGCTRPTVIKSLKRLEELNIISYESRVGDNGQKISSLYIINEEREYIQNIVNDIVDKL